VAARLVVIVTQCREGAESMRQIVVVRVIQGNRPGTAVEAGSRENAVGKG
jgi:hypothetical protein